MAKVKQKLQPYPHSVLVCGCGTEKVLADLSPAQIRADKWPCHKTDVSIAYNRVTYLSRIAQRERQERGY